MQQMFNLINFLDNIENDLDEMMTERAVEIDEMHIDALSLVMRKDSEDEEEVIFERGVAVS